MADFDDMLERSLSVLGTSVTYTPLSGSPVTLKVMPSGDDRVSTFGDSRVQSSACVFEVLKSALAAPSKGDTLVYKGVTYTVKSFRLLDEEKLIWFLDCYPS